MMQPALDSDVVLLGTGIAPLIAAGRLLAEDRSVLILNPDLDFFLEDSELPLDPFWAQAGRIDPERIRRNLIDNAFDLLSPLYPGAIELWPRPSSSGAEQKAGYHDPAAPHLRSRSRLWLGGEAQNDALERLYIEADELDLKPQALEGLLALSRFPGMNLQAVSNQEDVTKFRGMMIPQLSDLDVSRYRNGLLEFIRDRLSDERVVSAATQIELIPEGVRFHSAGGPRTARIRDAMLVFWTPRLSQWVQAQAKKNEVLPLHPLGVRVWEQWSLLSRDVLEPGVVGIFENMTVWAEVEGNVPAASEAQQESGDSLLRELSVLIAGPLMRTDSAMDISWASHESIQSLSNLCNELLRWEKFSIRGMRPRAVFEWENPRSFTLFKDRFQADVVCGCDGPVTDIMGTVLKACEDLIGEEHA